MKPLVILASLAALAGCSTITTERLGLQPLETVPPVDLERYVGTWYEIASFPQSLQRGCVASPASSGPGDPA